MGGWCWIVHLGGGSLQSLPMPEKLIIFQVGPLDAWSNWCDGPGARRLVVVQYKGWINSVDKD